MPTTLFFEMIGGYNSTPPPTPTLPQVGNEWGFHGNSLAAVGILPSRSVTLGNDVLIATTGRWTSGSGPSAIAPSDGVNTFNLVISEPYALDFMRLEVWRATVTTGGVQQISITPSGGNSCMAASAWEFNGLNAGSLVDQSAGAVSASGSQSATTAAITQASDLVFAAYIIAGTGVSLVTRSFTPSTTPTFGRTWSGTTSGATVNLNAAWEVTTATLGAQTYSQHSTSADAHCAVVVAAFKSP